MRTIALLFCLAASVFADTSIQLNSGVSGSGSFPAITPYQRTDQLNTSMRWEFRLHGNTSGAAITIPASRSDLITTNGSTFWVYVQTDGTLWATDWLDAMTDNNSFVSISGRKDILVRIVRDVAAMKWWIEIQNVDGSGYTIGNVQPITTLGTGPSSGLGTARISSIALGGGVLNAQLAWLRWRSGSATAGVSMPRDFDTAADLGDWEFAGNGNDTSGHGNNLSITGGTYPTTITYAPGCSAGSTASYRAGDGAVLDASRSLPLNGVNSLTYLWQQTSGPSTVQWSNRTTVNPTVTGLVFGTYVFWLRVTDSTGQSSTCTVKHGAVATDSKGIVVVPPAWAEHAKLIGPMTRLGKSPWTRYNAMQLGWADKQIAQYGTSAVVNGVAGIWRYWDVQAGTATVSTTVWSHTMSVSGGNAQTIFCGGNGNTTPASDTYIIVWWGSSEQNRHGEQISSCPDTSSIVVGQAWVPSMGAQTNKHFALATNVEVGRWGNISTNANYYDNVMALYATYLMTGIDTYLTGARTLADMWYDAPNIDHGYGCDPDGMAFCGLPRLQALTGLYMRALDGRSDMHTGLDRLVGLSANSSEGIYNSGGIMGDMREEGYRVSQIALCALYSPNIAATCKTWTQHGIANFVRQQRAAGNWETLQNIGGDNGYTGSMMNGRLRGTVTVTNGSNVVNLTGATVDDPTPTFTSGEMGAGRRFYTIGSFTDPAQFDATYYTPTYVSSTQITLDRPYTGCLPGPVCSVRYWETGNGWMGYGTQPFMMGIIMRALYLAALAIDGTDAASAANARAAIVLAANWLVTIPYNPTRHDVWYGIGFGGACPVGAYCDATGGVPDRNLSGEILGALALSQTISYSSTVAMVADDLLGAAWGAFGEPGYAADSYWLSDWYFGGFQYAFDLGKYLGFWWGFGGSESHAAQRLGNVDAVLSGTIRFPVNLALHPQATKARITITDPQGTVTVLATCTTACSATVDKRLSGHLAQIEYLSSTNQVVLSGATLPLRVQ